MKPPIWSLPACLCSVATVLATAAEPPAKPVPFSHPLANAVLAPELRELAARDSIDLSRREPASGASLPGDSLVFWVGAQHEGRSQQWLIQLTRSVATAAEQVAHQGKDVTKYLSWGSTVTFRSEVEALDVWLAGPVDVGATAARPDNSVPLRVRRTRVYVPGDYLRLGLDDSERVDLHIRRRTTEILKADPTFATGHIYALDQPVKPEAVALARPIADRIVFTPELERAWMGGYVALQAFYDIVNDTKPLRDIARIAVRKPAPWKLVKVAFGSHFTTTFGGPDARLIQPEQLGLLPVATETFEVPYQLSFGKEPVASGWMVVTRPLPPLDVGAGILALIAFHPKDPTRSVEIVALAAHHGGTPAKPAPSSAPGAPSQPSTPPAENTPGPTVALAAVRK